MGRRPVRLATAMQYVMLIPVTLIGLTIAGVGIVVIRASLRLPRDYRAAWSTAPNIVLSRRGAVLRGVLLSVMGIAMLIVYTLLLVAPVAAAVAASLLAFVWLSLIVLMITDSLVAGAKSPPK